MLKVGDVVYLKSNPEILMTVSCIINQEDITGFGSKLMKKQMRDLGYDGGAVQCRWFDGSECMTDFFKPEMLNKKS